MTYMSLDKECSIPRNVALFVSIPDLSAVCFSGAGAAERQRGEWHRHQVRVHAAVCPAGAGLL